jgi:hypothetical protein
VPTAATSRLATSAGCATLWPCARLCILLPYAWLCILPPYALLRICAWATLRLRVVLLHVRVRPSLWPDLRAKPAPKQRHH